MKLSLVVVVSALAFAFADPMAEANAEAVADPDPEALADPDPEALADPDPEALADPDAEAGIELDEVMDLGKRSRHKFLKPLKPTRFNHGGFKHNGVKPFKH